MIRTLVVCGDHQARYQDPKTERVFCSFLLDLQPDNLIINGDLLDLEGLSRFRAPLMKKASVLHDVSAAHGTLLRYREVVPNTQIDWLAGNHEERLENFIIDRAPELYDVAPTIPEMAGLDELGVNYHGPYGVGIDWYTLHVYHGKAVSAFSGYSARKEFDINLTSGASGHTQRLGVYYFTDGRGRVHAWFEAGCMCYTTPSKAPPSMRGPRQNNWQQGFVVVYYDEGSRTWTGYPVPIVKHSFIFEGVRYN